MRPAPAGPTGAARCADIGTQPAHPRCRHVRRAAVSSSPEGGGVGSPPWVGVSFLLSVVPHEKGGAAMPWIDVKLYDHRVTDESVPKIIEALTNALAESSGASPDHI